jgi:hypothetical protein
MWNSSPCALEIGPEGVNRMVQMSLNAHKQRTSAVAAMLLDPSPAASIRKMEWLR